MRSGEDIRVAHVLSVLIRRIFSGVSVRRVVNAGKENQKIEYERGCPAPKCSARLRGGSRKSTTVSVLTHFAEKHCNLE